MLPRFNIGCGPNVFPHDGWVNFDRESDSINKYLTLIKPVSLASKMPAHQRQLIQFLNSGKKIEVIKKDIRDGFGEYPENSVEGIYLGQMIEHINPVFEAPKFLKECHRLLRPGGAIRITTPDLDILIDAYKNGEMGKFIDEQPEFYKKADPSAQLAHLMYGASGPNCTWNNYEGHMFLYTKASMTKLLLECGFRDIIFFYEGGRSKDPYMAMQVVDAGLNHSFITEAVK